MASLTIKTNNVPRDYLFGSCFQGKERTEMLNQFDYLDEEEFDSRPFVNYRGYWYDLREFLFTGDSELGKLKWQGYQSDSYFSGVVIRYVENNERIVMGTYLS